MTGSARVTTGLLVGAMIRRTQTLGGSAMVLARGDDTAGAVLVALADRGCSRGFLERGLGANGAYGWMRCGPEPDADTAATADYLERRRRFDPDLWIVEIDLPEGVAMLAQLTGMG